MITDNYSGISNPGLSNLRNNIMNFIKEHVKSKNPTKQIINKAEKAEGNNLPAEKILRTTRIAERNNLPAEKISGTTGKGTNIDFKI